MKFIEFDTNSSLYKQALNLRQEILRAPLGLNIHQEDLRIEKNQIHYALVNDKTVCACVTAIPMSSELAKIRQMAVSVAYQNQGLGRRLFKESLDSLITKGFKEITLNARTSAVGFYQKFGFKIYGDEFTEVSIPHYKMNKLLS